MTSSISEGNAEKAALTRFRQLVPPLGGNYKGAHGKVLVVGGCLEFTGAPFFAAMSALRVGADMAYVVCTPSASTAIKCYSPELMVLPYLPENGGTRPAEKGLVDQAMSRITPWLSRASCVVVGPGLGGDPAVCETATALVREVRQLGLPLVVDGSALTHIVAQDAGVVSGYRSCVLTPNVAELERIARAVGISLPGRMSDKWLEHAPTIAQAFQGPVVLAKGEVDLICGPDGAAARARQGQGAAGPAPSEPAAAAGAGGAAAGPLRPLLTCSDPGSLRRCGGQGDVLAGTAAAFLSWAAKRRAHAVSSSSNNTEGSGAHQCSDGGSTSGLDTDTVAMCAFMACRVMRGAARQAFAEGERSMVAGDIIPHLHTSFKEVLGDAEGSSAARL